MNLNRNTSLNVKLTIAEIEREEVGFRPIRESQRYEPVDISEYLQQLDGDIREFTMQLQNEKYIQF